MQEGEQNKALAIARNMLFQLHLGLNVIEKATGLSKRGARTITKRQEQFLSLLREPNTKEHLSPFLSRYITLGGKNYPIYIPSKVLLKAKSK